MVSVWGFLRGFFVKSPPWFIAVAITAVMLAAMQVIYVNQRQPAPPDDGFTVRQLQHEPEELAEIPEPPPPPRTPFDNDQLLELVSVDIDLIVPDQPRDLTVDVGDPTSDEAWGDPGDSSTGMGVGEGGHRSSHVNPVSGPARGPGNGGKIRPGQLPNGPTAKTEEAVLEGMRWLVRHQNPDGSWGIDALASVCQREGPCVTPQETYSSHYNEGLTGLALLAFLGAGIGHDSKIELVDPVRGVRCELGDVVKRGLWWLKDRQKPDGSFSDGKPFLYNEALATLALCEAYGLSKNRFWRKPAQNAVDFLVRAQKPAPGGKGKWGWRYAPYEPPMTTAPTDPRNEGVVDPSESDVSVTCWAVMALKSAQRAGLVVPESALQGGLAYVKWTTGGDGLVGYVDPSGAGQSVGGQNDHYTYHVASMSSLGACVRIFVERDANDAFLPLAAKQIVKDLPTVTKDQLSVDYYYWYYGSLALNQFDGPDSPKHTGKFWEPWNKAMVASLLELQDRHEKSCTRGGWLVPDRWCYTGGPLYATALNVLTLEVYYRYPNALGGK
jgi:prenyltransferase/squalene oxidase-like repeat protein